MMDYEETLDNIVLMFKGLPPKWLARRMVRQAVRRLHKFERSHSCLLSEIGWAVIAPSEDQRCGWDYHLIKDVWGADKANRLLMQLGSGYVIEL